LIAYFIINQNLTLGTPKKVQIILNFNI